MDILYNDIWTYYIMTYDVMTYMTSKRPLACAANFKCVCLFIVPLCGCVHPPLCLSVVLVTLLVSPPLLCVSIFMVCKYIPDPVCLFVCQSHNQKLLSLKIFVCNSTLMILHFRRNYLPAKEKNTSLARKFIKLEAFKQIIFNWKYLKYW